VVARRLKLLAADSLKIRIAGIAVASAEAIGAKAVSIFYYSRLIAIRFESQGSPALIKEH
jgi:hypothetical protein